MYAFLILYLHQTQRITFYLKVVKLSLWWTSLQAFSCVCLCTRKIIPRKALYIVDTKKKQIFHGSWAPNKSKEKPLTILYKKKIVSLVKRHQGIRKNIQGLKGFRKLSVVVVLNDSNFYSLVCTCNVSCCRLFFHYVMFYILTWN